MIFAALESPFFDRQVREKIMPIGAGDPVSGRGKVAGWKRDSAHAPFSDLCFFSRFFRSYRCRLGFSEHPLCSLQSAGARAGVADCLVRVWRCWVAVLYSCFWVGHGCYTTEALNFALWAIILTALGRARRVSSNFTGSLVGLFAVSSAIKV